MSLPSDENLKKIVAEEYTIHEWLHHFRINKLWDTFDHCAEDRIYYLPVGHPNRGQMCTMNPSAVQQLYESKFLGVECLFYGHPSAAGTSIRNHDYSNWVGELP